MSENDDFKVPSHIKISNHIYSFKDELVNQYYSYRCKYISNFKIIIKMSKEELKKYLDNEEYEIKYEITGTQKYHMYDKKQENINKDDIGKEVKKIDKIQSIKKYKDSIKTLIFTNYINQYHFILKI